jgi:hypothetical protein
MRRASLVGPGLIVAGSYVSLSACLPMKNHVVLFTVVCQPPIFHLLALSDLEGGVSGEKGGDDMYGALLCLPSMVFTKIEIRI